MNSKDPLLSGGKAGGGKFRNRPDNLRSTDTFEAILGLTSSYTRLAPGGLKNLFVDGVPVEDGQGNASFKEFVATVFDGDPTVLEPVRLKLGQSAGPVAVNLALSNTYTNGAPGDWRNAAITTPGVDFVDLRFIVSQLYKQTKKGVGDQTASIEIQLRPSGSTTWHNPLLNTSAPTYNADGIASDFTGITFYALREYWEASGTSWAEASPGYLRITGKTTSPYVKEIRIAVPNEGAYANKTWEVRCRLIERDYVVSGSNGENEDRRTIQWESVAGVSSEELGGVEEWRGLSWVQIYGKATDQINGIPEITGIYDIGKHLVPPASVWDPVTRQYTGAAWDGVTNVHTWTACPAWQIKGLIEDDLSGISALAPGSTMNKWDTLEASKWFSELVPDGRGGMHPRYTLNWFQEQPMQVKELVSYLSGAVGAFCWDEGDGRWRMKVERPENPVMIFTKENIVGEFVYSHTDFDSRFNDFTGVFRNEENRYQEDRVRVFDQSNIDLTGRRHTTIALVGCTNRQEALRRLKIRLLSSLNETRQITFTTNRQGLLLEPLSVIAVADGDLNADTTIRSTGRIVAMNPARTEIQVRDTLRLELGVNYSVSVTVPNPDYNPDTTSEPTSLNWRKPTITVTRNIVNTAGQRGDITTLYLDSALPADTPLFAPVALSAVGLPALPKQYRVLNVSPSDDSETVVIQAIEIYTSKWVESDNVTEDAINSQLSVKSIPAPGAPADGVFSIINYPTEFTQSRALVARWLRPAALFLEDYRIEYRYNQGPWIDLGRTRETFLEIPNPLQGVYDIRVYANDRRKIVSLPLEASIDLDEVMPLPPTVTLSNAAAVVNATADGVVSSFAGTGGVMEVRTGAGLVPSTDITFSVVSTTGGLTISIDAVGAYLPTALTGDTGTAVLRATYNGEDYDLTYTLAKAKQGIQGPIGDSGLDGQPGTSVAEFNIYRRSATAPATPTGGSFNFTGAVLTPPASWSSDIPPGSNPVWVSRGVAVTNTPGGADTPDWSAPARAFQDGQSVDAIYRRSATQPATPAASSGVPASWYSDIASVPAGSDPIWVSFGERAGPTVNWTWQVPTRLQGLDGVPGLNSATVTLYRRSATAPAVPSTTATYTFATGVLTGQDNSWTQTIPAGTDPLYVITASAASTGATDTIAANEWSSPVILARDGAQGAAGLNNAAVFIYKRSASAPTDAPADGAVYTFATGVLSGTLNGWSTSVPAANGQPLWVRQASASSTGATDTINSSEWSAVQQLVADGAAGGNSAVVFIYARAASAPAAPTGSTTYTFSTGVLSGTLGNGWSQNIPAANGQPLWVRTATAFGTGSTDTIAPAEWSGATQLVQDGAPGLNSATVTLYRRSATTPTSVTVSTTYTFATGVLSGANNSWTQAIPSGTDPLWAIQATAASTGSTDTIASGEWTAPALWASPPVNNARILIYRRSPTTPALPSTSSTYTFSTGAISGLNNGWTVTVPSGTDPLWVSVASASSNGGTATIAAASWASAQLIDEPQPLGNANRVPFSRMEGDQGWGINYNPSSLAATTTYGTSGGRRFFRATATATASEQDFSIGHSSNSTPAFVLAPGSRVSVQARVETTGMAAGPWRLALFGFTAAGAQSELASVSGSGLRSLTAAPAQMFVDVPTNIVGGRLEFYCRTTGSGAFSVAIAEPMVTSASAQQVVHPPFSPGPNAADGATRNTGALADLNAVDLSGSTVTGTLPVSKADTALRNSTITINGSGIITGIGTANVPVANTQVALAGTLSARPASGAFTGQLYAATDMNEVYRWNDSSWLTAADVTAAAQRSIVPQYPIIEVRQGDPGHTGSRNITHEARRGTAALNGGTWSLPAQNLGAGTATIASGTGVVTLSGIVQSGSYTVRYTHTDGVVTDLPVNVTYVPASASGGSSSSGSSSISSFSSSSYTAVTSAIAITLPAGVTTATLTATNVQLDLGAEAPMGSTTVQMIWQRESSPGTWVNVGSAATSSPNPSVSLDGEGYYTTAPGAITCNATVTGLAAGSAQKFRLMARVSAGNVRVVIPAGAAHVSS